MLIKLKKHTRKSDNLRRLGHIAAAMTPQNYMDQKPYEKKKNVIFHNRSVSKFEFWL